MITVEKSVQINKPIETVFAYATNINNITKWQEGVESIEVEGDPNAVGGKYTEVRKFLGREMKTDLEITAYESNAKWAAKVLEGPVPYEVTAEYKSSEDGTKVSMHIDGEPSGFFKLAQGAVQKQLDKSMEEDLQRLKEQVEAS
ncbi:MAG: SRPBCC family protein [Anaerolineales bacterium]|jgi:uncharacterized membrane protein